MIETSMVLILWREGIDRDVHRVKVLYISSSASLVARVGVRIVCQWNRSLKPGYARKALLEVEGNGLRCQLGIELQAKR